MIGEPNAIHILRQVHFYLLNHNAEAAAIVLPLRVEALAAIGKELHQ